MELQTPDHFATHKDAVEDQKKIRASRKNLYLAAISANLALSACGCCFAWTSPVIPKLKQPGSLIPLDEFLGSWVGSLLMLGSAVGPFIAGIMIDAVGRKWTLLVDSVVLLVAWAILASAQSVWMLFVGRFMCGIAVGIIFMGVPLYIAEIAEDKLRGALGSVIELFLSAGFMIEYCAGPFLSYNNLILVSVILPILFIITFIWMPESPHYLLASGRRTDAAKSLRWLRGNISHDAVEKEITQIEAFLEESSEKKVSLRDLITNRGNLKALYVSVGLLSLQQLSGINVIQFYVQPIFVKTGSSLEPKYSAMIVGGVQLISACFTAPLTRKLGFKIPLLISAAGTCVAQVLLGIYFYMEEEKMDAVVYFGWVPIFSLVLYIFVFCSGLGPLPWAVMGEMFAPNMKALASAVITSFTFLLSFFVTKFFANICIRLGTHFAFGIFGASCGVAFVFVYYCVPNTKGMSLQDIQDKLNKVKTPPEPTKYVTKL
ncbi:facilitated trehalose transporter Tret1 [Nilaparvata lugens]|uniref:Sugar transporter 5 n=1 Tax=Nilaparvata lugens TaxID=108931 RepID=D4AHX0_NILLU|nr:facilitated trehalose transporter Tret1 [Nilaparvata lugens]XP_022184082.1 facilitated trehalose transporter Tret1 [Nilaparvata lugens]BAI83419.1 sugar transporter 5 [Nilaparvata lugens]